MVVLAPIAPPASRVADGGSTPAFDRVAVAAFMAIAIASGITG